MEICRPHANGSEQCGTKKIGSVGHPHALKEFNLYDSNGWFLSDGRYRCYGTDKQIEYLSFIISYYMLLNDKVYNKSHRKGTCMILSGALAHLVKNKMNGWCKINNYFI